MLIFTNTLQLVFILFIFYTETIVYTNSNQLYKVELYRHALTTHRNDHIEQQKQRIRRRLESNDVAPLVYSDVPLGVGFGTHYAELYLGLPPQRASVIVDTGSRLTALPCSQCTNCGTHTDPLFDMKKSTTAKELSCETSLIECSRCKNKQCLLSMSYTEGSMWEAMAFDEVVWIGTFTPKSIDTVIKHYGVRMPIGCQTQITGLFLSQKENGILGMARSDTTIIAHMLQQKKIEHNTFAMCFDGNGGSLVLGGVDYSRHKTQVEYTPLVSQLNLNTYGVRVLDILVGEESIGVSEEKLNSGRGVIVDSGTTDTFFASSGQSNFHEAFHKASGGINYDPKSMNVDEESIAKLPNVIIVLAPIENNGVPVQLIIPPSKYLTKLDDDSYYGNFHFSERSGGVLGASTMVGYDVIFDTENQRVGFAEASCTFNTRSENTTSHSEDDSVDHTTNNVSMNGDNPTKKDSSNSDNVESNDEHDKDSTMEFDDSLKVNPVIALDRDEKKDIAASVRARDTDMQSRHSSLEFKLELLGILAMLGTVVILFLQQSRFQNSRFRLGFDRAWAAIPGLDSSRASSPTIANTERRTSTDESESDNDINDEDLEVVSHEQFDCGSPETDEGLSPQSRLVRKNSRQTPSPRYVICDESDESGDDTMYPTPGTPSLGTPSDDEILSPQGQLTEL